MLSFQSHRFATAFALAIATAASAQGVGLGLIAPPAPFNPLHPSALGVSTIGQLSLTPIPGSKTYYLTATVTGHPAGAGSWDAYAGTWDPSTQTFTPATDVDALNSSGAEFQVSASPDLKYVVLDTPSGHPVGGGNAIFASRAGTSGPFGNPSRIAGVATGYIDPAFGTVGGKLALFWVAGNDIMVGDAVVTGSPPTLAVQNQRVAVVGSSGQQMHSPTPLNDIKGETRALVHAAAVSGSGSDAMFTSYADNGNTPPGKLGSFTSHDAGTRWINNPAAYFGSAYYADGNGAPLGMEFVAASSAIVPLAGGTANTTVWSPPTLSSSIVFVNYGLLLPSPLPIPLPFVGGSDLSISIVAFINPVGSPGIATAQLTIPAITNAATLYGQPVVFDPGTGKVYLGNTFAIDVR